MVLRILCCFSSGLPSTSSARSYDDHDRSKTLSAKIVNTQDNGTSRPSSRSSIPCPRNRRLSSTTPAHLLDEKVPNLLQTSPLNATSRNQDGDDSIHYSETSSAVSIRGPRIVSLISTDTGASRLSTRTEHEIRLPSIDDTPPPPPYSRTVPQQQEPRSRASSTGARHRRMHVHQNEFADYIQQLRQRIEPGRVSPPAPSQLQTQYGEFLECSPSSSPVRSSFSQHCDVGQASLESEPAVSSRAPSPPNAPLISRITTPSTFTTVSDRDEDFFPTDVFGEDPPLFPSRRRRSLSAGSQLGQQGLLEEAREGLFEELDRQMRFAAWQNEERKES